MQNVKPMVIDFSSLFFTHPAKEFSSDLEKQLKTQRKNLAQKSVNNCWSARKLKET
jgi:hypothetical protein